MRTRLNLALLAALALVWVGGCGTPQEASAWVDDARPLLERAEAVEVEMSRDDFDPEVARSLILETREALAAYESADEDGAEFEAHVRDAMSYYAEGLKAHEAKLSGVARQWIDQANGSIAEARALLERSELQ